MNQFTKTIAGIRFDFQSFLEGEDRLCWVSVDSQSFRMSLIKDGQWQIRQQVPVWIKKMEKQLSEAINGA